jgi:hypothetical protein
MFFSKYLELINCSQLINDLSSFAGKVDKIAADIGSNALKYKEEDVELGQKQDVITVVERLARRGKYFESMSLCVQ